MKIERFLSGAVAGDGGTISCRAVLHDGTVVDLGLDHLAVAVALWRQSVCAA